MQYMVACGSPCSMEYVWKLLRCEKIKAGSRQQAIGNKKQRKNLFIPEM
jgi:hypothetical protein